MIVAPINNCKDCPFRWTYTQERVAGKLLFLVRTPSLCCASNQSPEGARCLSGHFRGEKSKSREQGSQRIEKMWIKCQRIAAAVREHKQAFGSRSSYFHRASYIAYCLRSEGLAYKSFFANYISFFQRRTWKNWLRTASCQKNGNLGKHLLKLLGTWIDQYWLWCSLLFSQIIFLPGKFPEIVHNSAEHLYLHSSGQEQVAGRHQLTVTNIDSNVKPESSVPLARLEKSQRKLRNQFKQDYFYILRTCRSIHIDYPNIGNYVFFPDILQLPTHVGLHSNCLW